MQFLFPSLWGVTLTTVRNAAVAIASSRQRYRCHPRPGQAVSSSPPQHLRPTPVRGAAGLPAGRSEVSEAAGRFGYTAASVQSTARDLRVGRRDFFSDTKPGPKSAPAKDAARARIIELRRAGL
jgi:hypothetical protein